MAVGGGADPQGAVHAAQLRVAVRHAGDVLTAAEAGQQIVPAPAVGALGGPGVVAGAVAAQEAHGADGRAAAQAAASGPRYDEAGLGLRHGAVRPVEGVPSSLGQAAGRETSGAVGSAGLEEQHPGRVVLAEAGREHASRGARPHHDVVELACAGGGVGHGTLPSLSRAVPEVYGGPAGAADPNNRPSGVMFGPFRHVRVAAGVTIGTW